MGRAGEAATATATVAVVGYALAWTWRTSTVELKHYSPAEFGFWWPFMNRDLLAKLDRFRELWGDEVVINKPNTGGLGRVGAKHNGSQHYAGPSKKAIAGEVRAADITPKGINNAQDMQRAYEIAHQVGFTGIGLYPGKAANWSRPGLHVDVRGNRHPHDPAVWSRLNQTLVRQRLGLGKVEKPGDAYVARRYAIEPAVWKANA